MTTKLPLCAQEIREKWFHFFIKHDHQYLESMSLINHTDKSLLFVNSGVAAIKDYFVGNKKTDKPRLVNCQKVLRTIDINNIGKTTRHHTFFEMLGNFSIGDYFKEKAIKMAYSFLTEELGIEKEKLYFTIYKEDDEAYQIYKTLGIEDERLIKCGKDRNFWDMGCGPCGPCTEIYYDRGIDHDADRIGLELLIKDLPNERYLEIWNIVFSEFINENGQILPAATRNIDTGMGLERLLTILENQKNNFHNSLFRPIIQAIEKHCSLKYFTNIQMDQKHSNFFEVFADHYRACVMIIAEGITFSNKDKGYVLRKLFRRAMLAMMNLEVNGDFINDVTKAVVETLSPYYSYLEVQANHINNLLKKEYDAFLLILKNSFAYVNDLIKKYIFAPNIELEKDMFTLVERFGIPFDIIAESLISKGVMFSMDVYLTYLAAHKNVSKNKNFKPTFQQSNSNVYVRTPQPTKFLYDEFVLEDAEIICIFDKNLSPRETIDDETGYILLKETIFFPDAAGQERDYGYIDNCEVVDVIKNQDLEILHQVKNATFYVGQKVKASIDQVKRRQVSRHHTCEHIVYGLLQKTFSPEIYRVSAKKNHDHFTLLVSSDVELNVKHLSILEGCVQHLIEDRLEIDFFECDYDEAKSLGLDPDKLMTKNNSITSFNVVSIPEVSLELCIGTHLENCELLERVLLTNISKKGDSLYEITGIVGSENIDQLINAQKTEFKQFSKQLFDQINEVCDIIFKESGKNFHVLETKLNSYKDTMKNVLACYSTEHYIIAKEKENNFKEMMFEWKKDINNSLNSILFTKLTKLFDETLTNKVSVIWVEGYKQKEMFNFIKSYKLPEKVNTLVLFNKQDGKNQFYIAGNPASSSKILSYLKDNYSGVGGGIGIISGSIKISDTQGEEDQKTINTYIQQLNK